MANPLKKIERKREEPKLGEPKLVDTESAPEIVIAQELQGENVADTLIRARQQFGQDLRSIADVLCIRFAYLDAIERGQYENLPGATYAVGFVRTYAEYLGLDGDKVVERFKTEVEGLDNQTKLHFPTPTPEGKMPGGAVFLVAALLFAGAYGVWFYLSNQGESLSDLVSPVPERLQEMVGGGASPEVAESGTAVTIAPTEAPATEAAVLPEVQATVESAEQTGSSPSPVAETPAAPAAEMAPPVTEEPQVEAPPAEAVPAAPMSAPSDESLATATSEPTQSAVVPQESAATLQEDSAAVGETAPQAVAPMLSGGQVQSAEQTQSQVPDQSAALPPVAETPASGGASQSDAYAIPAAPDNNTPATSFLVNHEPRVYGEEAAGARIVLKATQDAWVQVRDRQGTLLLTRVLRVGDSYRVPNQTDLTLLTGNAGGLEISVDGRTVAPLGPVGAVRRNIPLDPEGLISGAGRQP